MTPPSTLRVRPRVAVVVVTYDSAPLLADLVASLPAGCEGTDWRVVVVDNASADESVRVARELLDGGPGRGVVLELGGNGGYAAGLNAGVAASGEQDAYLLLNPDVRLGPGCALELWRAAIRSGAGIAVPRLVDARGQLILSQRRRPSLGRAWADATVGAGRAGRIGTLGEVVATPAAYEREQVVDWAEGSTQLVTAACWRRTGPWDETFFLYSEETEYALRAARLGQSTVYVPTAAAQHLEGGSATSPALWQLVQVNRARLYSRQHGPLRSTLFWAALVVREASRAALGRQPNRRALRSLLSPRALTEPPGPGWLSRRM